MRSFPYLQESMPRFECITTCTDLEVFRPSERASADSERSRSVTLGYVGSVGVWYLFDETLRFFSLLRERLPEARLHILNRGGHEYIRERMNALHVDQDSVQLESTDHDGVATAMQQMDAGVFFIKPLYSKIASAPTKLGEFLGCGIPCVGNSGVGDMAAILEGEQTGVTLSNFEDSVMLDAVDQLVQIIQSPGISARCRDVAERYFSLVDGVLAYDRIYRELAG
jgi:glycosyltransferase involved in cell wall biosynthesis